MNLLAEIAATHLRGRLRQTIVVIAGVATGVGFSIAMAALMEGSERDFIERLVDATPHIVVKDEYRHPPPQPAERQFSGGAVSIQGLRPKEELRGIRNARARLAEIDRMRGLNAAPVLRGEVVMRYGGKDVGAALVGIEPARHRLVSQIEDDLVAGALDDLHRTANGVILGAGLAEKLGIGLGDSLGVSSPSGVPMRMKVAGLFRSGVVAVDDGQAYALLKKAQVLQDRPNVVNQIQIRLKDVRTARAVAARIEARLGYRTESWEEANEGLLEVLVIRNTIMYTVVGAILMVAAFGIFNVISTITHEKVRDIAILKSLGFPEADIRRIFVSQSLILGVAGSAAGCALGFALSTLLGSIQIELKNVTALTRLPVYHSWLHYAIAIGIALAAAGFAGYLPARKAARLDPVDIIRGAA